MNELILTAKFEVNPSENDKKMIEAEMRSFLSNIAIDAVLNVNSGTGSWWISVFGVAKCIVGWLSEQVASWVIKKSLDHISRNDTKKEFPDRINDMEPVHDRLAPIADKMYYIAQKYNCDSITFGYCDEKSRGLILSLRKGGSDLRFDIHLTNSREDFNSFTTIDKSI